MTLRARIGRAEQKAARLPVASEARPVVDPGPDQTAEVLAILSEALGTDGLAEELAERDGEHGADWWQAPLAGCGV